MPKIQILDSETIDKIAAGEVVERPASVVKELVENAMDAKATAITVEAKEGGAAFIRVTDNGSGMEREQLRTAFLRHATSKIQSAEDLMHLVSLGFRGEALSSICAVSKTEVITKTKDSLTGCRMVLEGGNEISFEEVGAPEGTTFLVRSLFFNTPVRRKFLKTAAAEGGYIGDLMEHLALSRPDISFKLVLGGQTRFYTLGNGDLKEAIYRIYGRETAESMVPVRWEKDGIRVEGYLGKPALVRSNRSFEIYFINGRFVKSSVVAGAIEEGYKEYLMQHKFPFCVLHIFMEASGVDVNVHPTKMDVRFSNGAEVCRLLTEAVADSLKQQEMIPQVSVESEKERAKEERLVRRQEQEDFRKNAPEPFEVQRTDNYRTAKNHKAADNYQPPKDQGCKVMEEAVYEADFRQGDVTDSESSLTDSGQEKLKEDGQLNLFEEKILAKENRPEYQLIGQVFGTYWLIQFEEQLLIIDQHAAHEKVKYERLMKQHREKGVLSQNLFPPVIVSLTGQEEAVLKEYADAFLELGFETENFGGHEYALRSVPVDLYGCSEREMFLEVMEELAKGGIKGSVKAVEEKIASMSCKAAVKGNCPMNVQEASALIDELLTLENPYHCPHGRPTIITVSRTEMEKKFKRIV